MSGLREYRDEIYPSNDIEFEAENMKLFLTFITERQNIWRRRFKLNLPREKWTKNPILKTTKYTNIYRQLDRGSLWCYHMIIRPSWKFTDKTEDDFKNLLWKLVVYRLFVRIETFEQIGLPDFGNFDPETYLKRCYEVIRSGQPIATNAFLTLGGLHKGMSRPTGLCYAMIYMDAHMDELCRDIREAKDGYRVIDILCRIPGVAGFMGYEVYCDLCYCKDAIKFNINDAVNTGPGCVEGLRLIFPVTDCKRSLTLPKLLELVQDQDEYFKMFNIKFPYMNWLEPVKNQLSLRTVEHSLCEFSKYWLQHMSLMKGVKFGKNRLQYDRWNHHPHCTVIGDGRQLVLDKDAYTTFKILSETPQKRTKQFKAVQSIGKADKSLWVPFLMDLQHRLA